MNGSVKRLSFLLAILVCLNYKRFQMIAIFSKGVEDVGFCRED